MEMQILPPLYNSFTTDYFMRWVNVPDNKDVLHIWFKCELIETDINRILGKLVRI